MELNDIVETLKANGFVENEKSKRRLVHPEARDFIIELYCNEEYDEIQIGDFRNYAALPTPAISSFTTESDDYGVRINIALTDDSVISLFCSFE